MFGKMHFLSISENEFTHEIKCKGMTSFMHFMASFNLRDVQVHCHPTPSLFASCQIGHKKGANWRHKMPVLLPPFPHASDDLWPLTNMPPLGGPCSLCPITYSTQFGSLGVFCQTRISSMKLVIPLHSLKWSVHTKDESKRGTAFAFIFGVN